jgi:hypothetical protein
VELGEVEGCLYGLVCIFLTISDFGPRGMKLRYDVIGDHKMLCVIDSASCANENI